MANLLNELYASHYFSTIHFILIVLHVTLALVAIVSGIIPMIARKGGANHRLVGNIYFWSMIASLLLAIVLLFFRFNVFLAGITVLSLNGVITGVRSLYRKQPNKNNYLWFDYAIATAALVAGVGLLGFGILTGAGLFSAWIPSGNSGLVSVILPVVFGVAIISDANKDLRSLRTPPTDRNWWWYYHMERMLGSYIALSTALAVQQIGPQMPESIMWIAWVAPSAIGTPLIVIWIKQYKEKFSSKQPQVAVQPGAEPSAI